MTALALLDLAERLEDAADYLATEEPTASRTLRGAAAMLRGEVARSLCLADP